MTREPSPSGQDETAGAAATWGTLVPLLGPALLVVGKLMKWLLNYRQEHPKPHQGRTGG